MAKRSYNMLAHALPDALQIMHARLLALVCMF